MRVNIRQRPPLSPQDRNFFPGSRRPGQHPRSAEKSPSSSERKGTGSVEEVFGELNSLIGLEKVKSLVREIYAFVEIQKKRQKEDLIWDSTVLHMIFKGNPGTGKTTVARIIGKLFKELGVLQKGHVLETERADIVGEYIGHTAQKTKEQIKKAQGGILFIDEAYSLARGGEKDFGKEAIDCLCKGMEDGRDTFILILAGYNDEMIWFLETNPGLRSRFPIQLTFPDYTTGQLIDIADKMLKERQYGLSVPARDELRLIIEMKAQKHQHNGNARLVRNLIERSMRTQAVRLIEKKELTREDLMTINREDMAGAWEEM
ncbi:MAG: stage V sporulation protein K [Peptococcaceae bacterium BICA1-7]|nr:MAG: stage V sporulation protein K [Peptococcaceae bacterium BICA1-7]HBV96964.1 stage V sporulation protein K [Desulfotomaculum sp.]